MSARLGVSERVQRPLETSTRVLDRLRGRDVLVEEPLGEFPERDRRSIAGAEGETVEFLVQCGSSLALLRPRFG